MKSLIKKIKISNGGRIYYLILWTILFAPSFVLADGWNPGDPIVPCDGLSSDLRGKCDFNASIQLIDNLLNFFIWVSVPISILVFAYIGWLYMTSGDKPEERGKANDILMALLKGLFYILASWLIVKTIISGLGADVNLLGN